MGVTFSLSLFMGVKTLALTNAGIVIVPVL